MDRPSLPLHVETMGLDPGPDVDTVVLLHGYGGWSFTWRHWTPALARRSRVMTVDLKGFGKASKPLDTAYGIEDQAALVLRLLRDDDARRVVLVGHSFGGAVALRLALHLLDEGVDRLSRMVLIGGAAYRQRLPPFVFLANHRRLSSALFRLLGSRFVVRRVLRSIVHDPRRITDDQVVAYGDALASPGARHALIESALRLVPDNLDEIVARFPEIDVPVLLMWGAHDRVVPPWVAHRLAAELPRATLHLLDECGHLPPEERPEDTLERLEAFLWGL